jgi:hypothetical protein
VAAVGDPGAGGRGTLLPGALENSNVDLAREFTELITAQRGFEANTRIIRAGDELLQSVMNLHQCVAAGERREPPLSRPSRSRRNRMSTVSGIGRSILASVAEVPRRRASLRGSTRVGAR